MTRTKGTYPWSSETQIVRDGQPSSDGDRSSESNDYHQHTHSCLQFVHYQIIIVAWGVYLW
jgi:hypothetical protein